MGDVVKGPILAPIVHLVATTYEGTCAALAAAVPLARGSGARLVILVPRIVSCAAELDGPVESTELLAKRYQQMVRQLGADAEVEVCTSVGLEDLVARMCAAHSRVVVGGPVGYWLTSPEERFANRLARDGCQVVFVASGASTTHRRVAA
jgi:hypothetical protein